MLKKIIPGYDNPQNPEVRIKVGRFAGFVGIFANVLLFAVKLIFGFIAGSLSVIVDSFNNLSDAGSNVLTVVGYTITGKPADKKHPFGYARMEYLCSLFISIIIAFLGVEMIKESISKLISEPEQSHYDLLTIIIISSTVLVKIAVGLFYRKLGKHIHSQTLMASSLDSFTDVIGTIAVVVGMLLTPVTGPKTDAVIGLGISVYIIIVGIKLVIESSNTLLGKAPDETLIKEIIQKIKGYDGVLGIHDLVVHSYGEDRCFATVHVEVDADGDVLELHDMLDNIENDFRKELNINLVVHMDPISVRDPEVVEVRDKVMLTLNELSSEYSFPISMHDFRMVKGHTHTNIIFDINVSTDISLTDKEIYDLILERIREINPLFNLVLTIDRDYFSKRFE